MDQQTIARIFLPFFTTKSRDLGTGLGLSMVYTIIQQHKGFIDVYSERGKGSVFSIYLPVLKGVNTGDEATARTNVPCGEGTVLIIDDEDLMRTVAKKILEKCGYSVLTASDGLEGVKIFRKKHREILCVLLDLAMPKKSGDIIYDELKEIDKNVKVVLTSGFRKDERVELAMTKGIDAFMQKPYTMEKLAQVIASISCERPEGKS
jgi:CheY-like chemotaxis protein